MDSDRSVTVVVTRVIRPGKHREFAEWADDVDRAAAEFEGHLGGARLHDAQGLNHLVYRFDTAEHLEAWQRSEQRKRLLARGDAISDEKRIEADSRAPWITVPGGSTVPKWKQFLITWVAAYPTLLLISLVVRAVAPGIGQPVTLAISSATLTALLTWLLLPRLNGLARLWLHRGSEPERSERSPAAR